MSGRSWKITEHIYLTLDALHALDVLILGYARVWDNVQGKRSGSC